MKVYILQKSIDLGSHVVDVYLDKKKAEDDCDKFNEQSGSGSDFWGPPFFVSERDVIE